VDSAQVFETPDDRIFLTIDFGGDFLDVFNSVNIGQDVHAVKLGVGFLLDPKLSHKNKWLRRIGINTFLDLKSHEDPDQMASEISLIIDRGFTYTSVHASASAESMVAAVRNAGNMVIVAALSPPNTIAIRSDELENIEKANGLLAEEGLAIGALMCNISQLKHTRRLGDGVLRIASGIRMPRDPANDQPAVGTPAEALLLGADMLAIGRTVTAADKRRDAYERVRENICSVQNTTREAPVRNQTMLK